MEDYNFITDEGTPIEVELIKNNDGKDKYIFRDPTGVNIPFTWTPLGDSKNGDYINPSQQRLIETFKKEFLNY